MRLLVQHRSHYQYSRPAILGPHLIRLRPASHTKATVEAYSLTISPEANLRWQQDPSGNRIARMTYPAGVDVHALDVLVEMAVEIRPLNPFDFFLDERCEHLPFQYPDELDRELAPFLDLSDLSLARGPKFDELFATMPRDGHVIEQLVEISQKVNAAVRYVIREEPGVWTPEETLTQGRGSCRDSAMLLVAVLRSMGLASRFVSGFLIQLTDEGMLPDQPKGLDHDVVDLHAWAEVYLPGAGWIGLDATSGLMCGEGHIPLACTATPALASPIEGTSDIVADSVSFSMTVRRLGHEPQPTRPYEEEVWQELLAAGDAIDQKLLNAGVKLTIGGEPTFNSREVPDAPEWNTDALGPTKWAQGLRLAHELRQRMTPGGFVLHRMGKHYPGESLPRWALELFGRRDGHTIWRDFSAQEGHDKLPLNHRAQRFAERLATRLEVEHGLTEAFEDPWRFLQDEASLPVDVDPLKAKLTDSEERRRLARVLDRGLATPVGWALPLMRSSENGRWLSERWQFRRGHLFLLQGDSPMGLRLPLRSLGPGDDIPTPKELDLDPPDPRREEALKAQRKIEIARAEARAAQVSTQAQSARVRTALCVEERGHELYVFLPPTAALDDFLTLLSAIDEVRHETGFDVVLEGYPPPSSPELIKLAVTPDPGVLEVNVPPSSSIRQHDQTIATVFEAALHAGLHSEKYMLDGRQAGSGGGNHITLGGATTFESPFLRRPDLLASLLTLIQHHPSISYMFTGLFVGPTSQAPRIDEARHEALHELEIALDRAFRERDGTAPPWLTDMLFRHLLVDVAGNTHRTELCIDKLFDPATATGRQGLIELRAFEMPPHPRMVTAQAVLARGMIAACVDEPYRAPLVRWGQVLHDRFLLPSWMWRDFEDVLDVLERRGVKLSAEAYRPFIDLRCPLVGTLQAGDVTVEVRNAIEPWHVLGEEATAGGTSRYVDSSMERVEVLAKGLIPERHAILVNGHVLPMRRTRTANEVVAGVRFRAWAPPHSLQPHIGIHHPLRIDVLDTWGRRSLGAAGYHVWHPEGRAFDSPPLTRFEAGARRAQRFTIEGPLPYPLRPVKLSVEPDAPYTIDLRRHPLDRPMPEVLEEDEG
ncbi:MAG: transglutaminase family protein [Polyangiaceae bacterium]